MTTKNTTQRAYAGLAGSPLAKSALTNAERQKRFREKQKLEAATLARDILVETVLADNSDNKGRVRRGPGNPEKVDGQIQTNEELFGGANNERDPSLFWDRGARRVEPKGAKPDA